MVLKVFCMESQSVSHETVSIGFPYFPPETIIFSVCNHHEVPILGLPGPWIFTRALAAPVGVTLGVRELREPGTTWPVVLDSWDLPQISPRSMVNDMVNGSNKFGDTVRYCQTVKFVGLYTNVQKKTSFCYETSPKMVPTK
jgi:hypothetical protein